ncbi:MAG TPA: DHHA1 domain-containing protein, partial [bacterium]
KNSRFPFRELSGVGVAFYLAVAVRKYLRERGYIREGFPKMKDYLDLVAIGTICDVVPLLGENRIFSRIGLELLSNSRRPGIIALKKVSNINNEVTCSDVAFRMGPRINAGGRVSSPETGFKLLLEDDMAKAEELAEALNSENLKRQSLEEKMLANVQNIIDSGDILKEKKSIVLSSEEWHPGIMGIVASRLVDRYFRPVALISVQDGIGRGSARSIPAFNINEALEECRGFLEGFGGHRYAAGFRIKKEMIAPFSEAFEKTVLSRLSETDFFQKQYVDREITMKDIDEKLLKELQQLKPFGMGNREPTFLMRSLNILSLRTAGNKHLMLKLSDGRTDMDAVGFRMGDLNLSMKNHIHALFYPEIHEWNGNRILRMRLEDIKAV